MRASRCRCSKPWSPPGEAPGTGPPASRAWCVWRNRWEPPARATGGTRSHLFAPAEAGRDFELATNSQLKPLAELRDYLTIVSNTDCRIGRGLPRRGDRRRPRPIDGGVPDPVPPETDSGLGHPSGNVARSAARAALRPRHRACLARAVHRGDRPRRRLRLQLPLRVHHFAGVGIPEPTASGDSRASCRVGTTVRRRRHAGRPRGPASNRPQHDRLDRRPRSLV